MCEPLERSQIITVSWLVRETLPIPSEVHEFAVEYQANPGSQPVQSQIMNTYPRWSSRDKRTALTIRQDALVIETTLYEGYEQIRTLLELALNVRIAVAIPAGVERIGLRYIDEIRVPSGPGGNQPSWQDWIMPELLGPTHIAKDLGLVPTGNEGLAIFSGKDSKTLVLRYGAQDDYAVRSTPDLRRPLPPPGPLFRLDIDSFWQPVDEVPEFDEEGILAYADQLHEPVRGVFESVISERLRDEVLRHV